MSIVQTKMSAIRAVFTALFDAVDVAGEFDEGKWEDLIAAFNATGRLVFGWPHLESSESDIFAALDEISDTLDATKNAMEITARDTRIVLHELHEAIGPADRPDPDPVPDPPPLPEPSVDGVSEPTELTEPARDTGSTDPSPAEAAVTWPSSVVWADSPSPSDQDQPGAPQRPNAEDEALFAVVRADPSISMAAAERAVGLAYGRGTQRMNLLASYGTLPDDIKDWRVVRSKTRGVPKGVSSQKVREEINARTRAPQTIEDALAVDSFDERRKKAARERAEQTWRERHPQSA